jgi:hypothetical protein
MWQYKFKEVDDSNWVQLFWTRERNEKYEVVYFFHIN